MSFDPEADNTNNPKSHTELHAESHTEITLSELKALFAEHLSEPHRLRVPQGVPTGIAALDNFLFWKGLPKGALSLMSGTLGTGATSTWIEAAAQVLRQNRWVAWVNHDVPLFPLPLYHRGLNLERLVSIESPGSPEKLFWLLQELMSSSLFELIGCDLGQMSLKEHQLRKLQAQARSAHIALVFLSQRKPPRGSSASIFSLILCFEKKRLVIARALHRPTPHSLSRSLSHARFTLHTRDRISPGTTNQESEHAQSQPRALPQASGASKKRI